MVNKLEYLSAETITKLSNRVKKAKQNDNISSQVPDFLMI